MKLKENYMLRQVADTFVVVPIGSEVENFNGMINLNGVGAFLWRLLETETTFEDLLKAMTEEYEVDEETARKDLTGFVQQLEASNLLA